MAKRFPHQMAKKNPHFQIDIFVIWCEKHSRRNAFRTEKFLIYARVYCNCLFTNISTDCNLISAPFLIQITPIINISIIPKSEI